MRRKRRAVKPNSDAPAGTHGRLRIAQNPQMKRALENFKAVLDLKVNQQSISDAQLKQIIGVIDRAAMEISQLD